MDKVAYDSRLYTDVQGLEQLRYKAKNDADGAQKEVAKQFEAIFLQMVLHSMRDATKAVSSDLFGSDQMELYQDIFDKQLSLMMSENGVGFADMIERNIDGQKFALHPNQKKTDSTEPHLTSTNMSTPISIPTRKPHPVLKTEMAKATQSVTHFETQEDFVHELWPAAKVAGNLIGVNPEILMAQAALETNWGKKIVPHGNTTTHNLFNIKAGDNWNKPVAPMGTLEHKNGVLVKEKSNFRSYASYLESFLDYANLIKQNVRYSDAVSNVKDPKKYVQALQTAGYATDINYADKIMHIFTSPNFKRIVSKLTNNT